MILYGIRNCDTVKKARAWQDAAGVAYDFHDYKTAGVPEAKLRAWVARLGWDGVLNRSGTTFRKLSDAERSVVAPDAAVALMLAHPSVIRRPLLDTGETVLAGFRPDAYSAALGC
ncbi:ArsC family reductase [Sphingomonas sp.]|uniref:ArsC family reductase n=1 Tax=Sphingomonas sp. TaxID=28214 RepID=UPI003CC5D0ED